jgi:hypothetical protein
MGKFRLALECAMDLAQAAWHPAREAQERVAALIAVYRDTAQKTLHPLVLEHYPAMLVSPETEYRKMIELTTKMMVVGHACAEILGHDFEDRRQQLAALYGGCCFIGDSFIDDFGEAAAQIYVARFGELLATGWFELQTDRELLFYAIITRLFSERDLLDPVLRQAIALLHRAQTEDVALRAISCEVPSPRRLADLRTCARNRSGHAILVLCAFLSPDFPYGRLATLYAAGALVMYIDDHGDSFADLGDHRATYMNQITRPERMLKKLFLAHITRLHQELPAGSGRDLMIAFLTRYYVSRLEKNRQQRRQAGSSWAVYE